MDEQHIALKEAQIMLEIEKRKAEENLIPNLTYEQFDQIFQFDDSRTTYKALAERLKGDLVLTSASIDKQRITYKVVLKLLLERKVDQLILWLKKDK